MPHGHGLVSQQLSFDTIALATLSSRNSLIVNSAFSNPTNSFLCRRIRYFAQLEGRTAVDDGPIVIGCAHGDADVSEIAAAMNERNVNGPDDITNLLDQDNAWAVYQNTVVSFVTTGDPTRGQTSSAWVNFGGKNGIPIMEGSGLVVFAFNCGSGALTTGSTVNGLAQVQGVWLRD